MDPDLQLDPLNPPKYCPQCARSGLKSKVKKFKMDPTSSEVVIMCKNDQCPWPFSVQSQAGATVKTDCGADSPSATSTPSRPSSRKRKMKQKTATQDSNQESEPPDNISSPGNKKAKVDSSVDQSKSVKSISKKTKENVSPTEEVLKTPSKPSAPTAAVNDRKEVDVVCALSHGALFESDQILPINISTTDEITQKDVLSNEDSNKPDSFVNIPSSQEFEPQSDIAKHQGQVLVGFQASRHEKHPVNQVECRDDPTPHKQTSGLDPSSLAVFRKVVVSPPVGIQTPPNQTLAEDQIPYKQILAKAQLPLKQASAVVLSPPLQASDVHPQAIKASPDEQRVEIEASPNVQTLAIQDPSCVDSLPKIDTSEDQILPIQDPSDVQEFPEQVPPEVKNTPEQADSDVLNTQLQSHLELLDVQNCQVLVPLVVQNTSVLAPPDAQNTPLQVPPEAQNTPVQVPPDAQNTPVQAPPDVQNSPGQSLPDVHSPLDVQNIPVQAFPYIQNTSGYSLKDDENVPSQVPPDVQNTPIQSSPDVQKTPVAQSPPDAQYTPIQSSDVQNTPIQSSPDVQKTPVAQSPPDAQYTPIQSSDVQNTPIQSSGVQNTQETLEDVQNTPIQSSDVQNTPIQSSGVQNTQETLEDVQNTSVQATPDDVQNIPKQAHPDNHHTPMHVPPDVQTPLIVSLPGFNTDPSPVAILSSPVCRKAVSLEPALEVNCEHAVLAASSLKLLIVNKIKSQKDGQTAKRNEVITRSGRKVKPKIFHPEDKQGSREASVTKKNVNLKNVIENVPALESVSNIHETEVNKVSKKIEGIEQMDIYADVLDEDAKNLEEEKRIQSLIKPPYPRRRQRGRKIDKEVIKPSLKSPSSKRSNATSKLYDEVVSPAKPDILTRSGKSEQTVATANQNLPAPQLTHPDVSDKSDTEAESLKSLNDDLIEKVTKVLEKQNKESLKIDPVTNCENLPGNFSMVEVSDDYIERIVDNEDIQFIKPKRTFQRVKKVDKVIFHPSKVSEVIEVENINLDVGARQKEGEIFCPPSLIISSEVRDSEMENVFKLGTRVALKHMTEGISDEEDESECSLSEVVLSEPECEFETSTKENSEVSKVGVIFDIQSTEESFFWRGWTIDLKFMANFSDYLRKLINKWKPPKNISIDPRIHVLLKEKEWNSENPELVLKMISFFSDVFVKYIYIKTNFPKLGSGKVLGLLKQCLALENKQIMKEIQILRESQKTTAIVQPSAPISKPVKRCITLSNTSSCPPTAHLSHPTQSPCSVQPLNLSSATKVPVLLISTTPGEEEDTSTEIVPIETSSQSAERNHPPTTQVKDLLDKENIRKRKGEVEVDSDGYFEEFSGIESNKCKKKKVKSIEKSKLREKLASSEGSAIFGENLSEKKGNLDVLKVIGRKADINTGKKSRNIGGKIGNGEKLVEKSIKEERQKTDNPTKKAKILSHRDGGLLNKILNTTRTQPVDTKYSQMEVEVDEKVNLFNKMGGSRRKNFSPTQVLTEVKPNRLGSQVAGVPSMSSGIKLEESMSKRQGKTTDSKFNCNTEEYLDVASSSNIVQKSTQVKALAAPVHGDASKGLGSFEQAFARKKQTEKIKKVLEIQKRKAEAGAGKKYKGFGEAVDPVQVVEKKKKKKEKKVKEIVKKAQVSKSEKDLMEELLSIADTAVAVSKSTPVMNKSTMEAASRQTPVDTSAVFEFEELHTLGGSLVDEGNIIEDFDSLFEF